MKEKNIVTAILLSIVTCGIYGIVWFVEMTNDAKTASNDQTFPSGGVAFLLTLITCGIYGIYWAYKMGELVKKAQQDRNLPVSDNSILYLILMIIGLGIVDYCLIQNDLNTIAKTNNTNTTVGA